MRRTKIFVTKTREDTAEKRGRGGLFFEYDQDSDTYGTDAAVHVKEEYNCERVPLYHWKMIGSDYCLCLRALRDIKASERISVGPDYTGGWRLNPYSEAGYYHHLMNTPEKIVFESTKPTKRRGGEVTKKARKAKNDDNEEENISNVKIKRHGPWLCAYIDNVEQGINDQLERKPYDEDEGKKTLQKLLASIEASLVLNTFARWQPSLLHSDAHQTIAGSYRFCVPNGFIITKRRFAF